MKGYSNLNERAKYPNLRAIVCLSVFCLFFVHSWNARAEDDDHDHDEPAAAPTAPKKGGGGKGGGNRAPGADRARGSDDGCQVSPQRLADFANGEAYDFSNLVGFLTIPACSVNARTISQAAISGGIAFNRLPPYRLDYFAKGTTRTDLESGKSMDNNLATSIPALLRSNPMGSEEMLPILGQLALLSPRAARSALTNLIQQEIYAGDRKLSSITAKAKPGAASDLARTLMKLGAGESVISSDMAESVEDMALLAQADSLGRYFRGLAAAASAEGTLVSTFNLSAGALNRGVQRGKQGFSVDDRAQLLTAVFTAIRASMAGSESLEPGAAELNEAMGALFGGAKLSETSLRSLWKEATKILAQSGSQSALADAITVSLTPQLIFLNPTDRDLLLTAGRNYPQVAKAIQQNFLAAWIKLRKGLFDGGVQPKLYNSYRERYFEPLVVSVLDFDPAVIDAVWLNQVAKDGLLQDEDIEKKFPKLVLALLSRRMKATKGSVGDPTNVEPTLSSMSENMTVLSTLSKTHIPTLMKWVKKYEQQ